MPTIASDSTESPHGFNIERIVHSIKTALACLIGFSITKLSMLHLDQWLVITIIVVMCAQINVGSVLNKASMRFLGTLSGSILAALTLAIFGANPIAIGTMIVLSAAIFSYVATSDSSYSDAGTLGAVTVVIILINQHPTVFVATHRFFEISFGILLAALFSQFIFPIHARDHLRRMQAKTIKQMRNYYIASLITHTTEQATEEYEEIDENIVASLSSQRALAKQSSREAFGEQFNHDKFSRLLHCEKEIFRSIVCMRYATDMLPTKRDMLLNLAAVKNFNQSICDALDRISPAIELNQFAGHTFDIPSVQALKDALAAAKKTMPEDDIIYMNGFLFCAELLVVQLTQLVILLEKNK
ncbi:MAG: FUSC family protein [Gammaproteobacteria bacterium]|nr:FUSC family protein [Gammaproteobacteria bacterium]